MDLADNDPKIHITGGEPFLYYDHLAELMTRAKALKLTPPDMIETNGFWAVDKKLISEIEDFCSKHNYQYEARSNNFSIVFQIKENETK